MINRKFILSAAVFPGLLCNPSRASVIELSDVGGSVPGLTINGMPVRENFGGAVSFSEDFNGDGISDVLIGATLADSGSNDTGNTYVIFGSSNAGGVLELSDLEALSAGLVLNGVSYSDGSGTSVSGVADFNGDDDPDIFISAIGSRVNGVVSGQSYIVFGDSGFGSSIHLSDVGGSVSGLVLNGEMGSYSGAAVSEAGDFNGDNISEVLVGATRFGDGFGTGAAYLILGNQNITGTLELSETSNASLIRFNGANQGDFAGIDVSVAGDVNGDMLDDFLVGADRVDSNGEDSGQAYLIFGSDNLPNDNYELSDIGNQIAGLTMRGASAYDRAGFSVSGIGDFNNDGFSDIAVSAPFANGSQGDVYIVFGSTSSGGVLELSDVGNIGGGVVLSGSVAPGLAGVDLSSAGDFNNDGFDDLLIGSNFGPEGSVYLIFGSSTLSGSFELTDISSAGLGMVFNEVNSGDQAGVVGSAGDFNDDGFADLIIGARLADSNGLDTGQAYVIFGNDIIFSDGMEL